MAAANRRELTTLGRAIWRFILVAPLWLSLTAGSFGAQESGAAGQALSTSASADVKATIFRNETAVWEAAKQHDLERFRQLVAPDALMIFTSGVKTRAEYLASIASRRITSYRIDDFHVYLPAPNAAISVYRATISGVFNGKSVPPTTTREASVWVKRGNRLVAVLNQETPLN
jgi:hypothetical protein